MIYVDQGSPKEIYDRIDQSWLVVDIGGSLKPIQRANFIVDLQKPVIDGIQWIPFNFGHGPYKLPFADNEVDFVWCQQTLEDLADPFFLMSEIIRIGKAGFIEIPNREWEHVIGVNSPNFCGFSHHRWYGELVQEDEIIFELTMKSPYVFQYGLIPNPPDKRNLGFVWIDSFKYREKILLNESDTVDDIREFKNVRRYNQIGVYI